MEGLHCFIHPTWLNTSLITSKLRRFPRARRRGDIRTASAQAAQWHPVWANRWSSEWQRRQREWRHRERRCGRRLPPILCGQTVGTISL